MTRVLYDKMASVMRAIESIADGNAVVKAFAETTMAQHKEHGEAFGVAVAPGEQVLEVLGAAAFDEIGGEGPGGAAEAEDGHPAVELAAKGAVHVTTAGRRRRPIIAPATLASRDTASPANVIHAARAGAALSNTGPSGRGGFPTLQRLKGLMEASQRRFKPVFAGLHQVQRFHDLPNTPGARPERQRGGCIVGRAAAAAGRRRGAGGRRPRRCRPRGPGRAAARTAA